MILIRSSIYFAFLVISIALYAPFIAIVGWFFPYEHRSRMANSWGRLNLWLQDLICGLKYEIDGLERIPDGGCIILAKHQSAWETIALRGILPPKQSWVLKRELLWVPLFGWALAVLQVIAINRKTGSQAVKQIISFGAKHLEMGRNVVIFPEGTRVPSGTRKKYGIGGALLAHSTGVPVIPIAHNAGVYWRRRDLKKYPGTIKVIVGPAIETKGLSSQEINRQVEEWIEGTVASLPQIA